MKNSASLDQLRIFLAVLDAGGFRAAARRLGTAPSRVSTTLSKLEADLGVPLLLRSTRSVRATEQGRRLAEQVRPLFEGFAAAIADVSDSIGVVRGSLKLNVPGAVVPDILPPLVSAFRADYPQVDVEILVDNDLVDIIAAGCDAGVRYGSHLAKDMISIPIGPRKQQIALAASPAYIEAHGLPRAPAELTGHAAIRYRLPSGQLLPWRLRHGAEVITIEPEPVLTISVNAFNSGMSYAREGLGIIGAFRNWCDSDFEAGTLVPVLQDWWPERDGPRLYYPSRFTAAPLKAFIETCRRLSV